MSQLQLWPTCPTPAITFESPCCSCKLTRALGDCRWCNRVDDCDLSENNGIGLHLKFAANNVQHSPILSIC